MKTIGIIAICTLSAAWAAAGEAPQMPMPINHADSAPYRWLNKQVHESRLLDNMEDVKTWSLVNEGEGKGEMALTAERAKDGTHSLRLRAGTYGGKTASVTGRPPGSASAMRPFNGEDWGKFNRISVWVYPDLPGFRVVSLLVVLHNDGVDKVPNIYGRDGLDYVILRNHEWNHVVTEIAHLGRDKVTGVEFRYRLQGNEPGATDTVQFDIDKLELERVDPDYFTGWGVWPGRIWFSHTGYPSGAHKTALATGLQAREFRLIRQASGETVLTKPVRTEKTPLGEFQILDFSEAREPGSYIIEAGEEKTQPFRIDDDVWAGTIWKALNFFFVERCGFDVPGSHRVCHRDWQGVHGDKRIIINGGWHDAGDLSQGIVNTSEAVYAMLDLAERLKRRGEQAELSNRLIEEAKWGLDWVLKTSFGDGYRISWATHDFWTNGILGDIDDVTAQAANSPYNNFLAAAAEAMAYRVLRESDPGLAADSLKKAVEDWQFAAKGMEAAADERMQRNAVLLNSTGVLASVDLYAATGEGRYRDLAIKLAQVILNSQQRTYPAGWSVPLTGFFYTSPKKDALLHYVHPGFEQAPIVAMTRLCETFPNHAEWTKWYSVAALYAEYLKAAAAYSAPYGMLPASIYREDEWQQLPDRVRPEDGDVKGNTREQIMSGVALGGGYRLRLFPVWHSRRGNNVIILPQAKALAAAAHLRGDYDGADLAERQLEWVVGRNPFSQSVMYGEGYDFAPQYTSTSGDMVGSLPVGIQTWRNTDVPYYSAMNCYNHKEIWVHPVSRWIWVMRELAGPALVEAEANGPVELRREGGGTITVKPDFATGRIRARVPAGRYTLESGGQQKTATLLSGATYGVDLRPERVLDFALSKEEAKGEVVIRATVRGGGRHRLELRAENLTVTEVEKTVDSAAGREQTVVWRGKIQSADGPWIAVVIPDGQLSGLREVMGRPQ